MATVARVLWRLPGAAAHSAGIGGSFHAVAEATAPLAACRTRWLGYSSAAGMAPPSGATGSSSSSSDSDSSGGGGATTAAAGGYQQPPLPMYPQHAEASTVDAREAGKFGALAAEWWDPSGPFAPLHALNPVRCRFLRTALCSAFGRDTKQAAPLAGLRLLDVGCGGGLLAESLARMGAHVTGIDVNEGGIATAQAHAARDPDLAGRLHYHAASAEQLVAAGEVFDAVIASEVIEHVASLPAFCSALAALTHPGGGVAISTLNRTPRSYLAAILGAEYILRWVPPGTHDWQRFLTPSELVMLMEDVAGAPAGQHGGSAGAAAASAASTGDASGTSTSASGGLRLELLAGMEFNPLTQAWSLGRDTGINYIAWFSKPAASVSGEATRAAAVGKAAAEQPIQF